MSRSEAVAWVLVILLLAGYVMAAAPTFSSVIGIGTYQSGAVVLPICPADISTLRDGSMCFRPSDRGYVIRGTGVVTR